MILGLRDKYIYDGIVFIQISSFLGNMFADMVRFVDVSDLVPTIPKKRIRVKVLRRYDGFTLFNSTLELIFVDKKVSICRTVFISYKTVNYNDINIVCLF